MIIKKPSIDLDLEKRVITSLLRNETDFVMPLFKGQNVFYNTNNQIVFEAISTLHKNGQSISAFMVHQKVKGKIDVLMSEEYDVGLGGIEHTKMAIEHLMSLYVSRLILNHTLFIHQNIDIEPHDLISKNKDFNIMVENLLDFTQHKDSNTVKKELLEEVELRNNGINNSKLTLIEKIDEVTNGFENGRFTVIAGRPGSGKTALAVQIGVNLLAQNFKPLIFNLEMNSNELVQRFLANRSLYSNSQISKGFYENKEDFNVFKNVSEQYDLQNLTIYDNIYNLDDIIFKCKEEHKKGTLDIVFIDYIQLITTNLKNSTREQEIAIISRQLKKLAKDLNVPVVGLAQLSRGVESRGDKRPIQSDLRESGQIEQDADVIAMLYRPYYYDQAEDPNALEYIVRKNRNGRIETIHLYCDLKYSIVKTKQSNEFFKTSEF